MSLFSFLPLLSPFPFPTLELGTLTGLSPDHRLAVEAATKALLDAGINYDDIQQAFAGYVYGVSFSSKSPCSQGLFELTELTPLSQDSTCGQRALYALGMTGIPIINVNNNCSTGSSALWLARQAIEYGISDCVMALGFEKMAPGSLATIFDDRDAPLSKTVGLMADMDQMGQGPFGKSPSACL